MQANIQLVHTIIRSYRKDLIALFVLNNLVRFWRTFERKKSHNFFIQIWEYDIK